MWHSWVDWFVCFFGDDSEGVEQCKEWSSNMTQQIDLAFNIFFMVYFFIRVSHPPSSIVYRDENKILK